MIHKVRDQLTLMWTHVYLHDGKGYILSEVIGSLTLKQKYSHVLCDVWVNNELHIERTVVP